MIRDLRSALTIYVVFHSKLFPELYNEIAEEDKKYLTYYGVRDKTDVFFKCCI
jgi:hypothetical protein